MFGFQQLRVCMRITVKDLEIVCEHLVDLRANSATTGTVGSVDDVLDWLLVFGNHFI